MNKDTHKKPPCRPPGGPHAPPLPQPFASLSFSRSRHRHGSLTCLVLKLKFRSREECLSYIKSIKLVATASVELHFKILPERSFMRPGRTVPRRRKYRRSPSAHLFIKRNPPPSPSRSGYPAFRFFLCFSLPTC